VCCCKKKKRTSGFPLSGRCDRHKFTLSPLSLSLNSTRSDATEKKEIHNKDDEEEVSEARTKVFVDFCILSECALSERKEQEEEAGDILMKRALSLVHTLARGAEI
jgi:TATA-binding protein-associated factor Taf7